jgi:hypothetical protein
MRTRPWGVLNTGSDLWFPFDTNDFVSVPAYGVMMIVDANESGEIVYTAKPDGSTGGIVINGPCTMDGTQLNSGGSCTRATGRPVWAACDDGVSSGDTIGPQSGSWTMGSSGSGFHVILSDEANGVALVVAIGASTVMQLATFTASGSDSGGSPSGTIAIVGDSSGNIYDCNSPLGNVKSSTLVFATPNGGTSSGGGPSYSVVSAQCVPDGS